MVIYWKHMAKTSLDADYGIKPLWSSFRPTGLDVLFIHSLDPHWTPGPQALPSGRLRTLSFSG